MQSFRFSICKFALVLLVTRVFPFLFDWRTVGLNVGEGEVDFWMLEFVMLVEASLAAIRLPANFDCALIISFDFISIPPHALGLLVLPFA